MQANKSRDTGPEMALRRELFRRGLRYRVDVAPLPGVRRTVDIVFPTARVAVLVDGCFWHGCPEHHRAPKTHVDFWETKMLGTIARDAETTHMLQDDGWQVIRLWEHEPTQTMADIVEDALRRALEPRQQEGTTRGSVPAPDGARPVRTAVLADP